MHYFYNTYLGATAKNELQIRNLHRKIHTIKKLLYVLKTYKFLIFIYNTNIICNKPKLEVQWNNLILWERNKFFEKCFS